MAKASIARRTAAVPGLPDIRAAMVDALGYSGAEAEVLRQAGQTLRAIMTDADADAGHRLRAVGMVLDLIGPGRQATREHEAGQAPLVNLTLVQAPPTSDMPRVTAVPIPASDSEGLGVIDLE